MFGFKSKKDKRIEELERQLSCMYMRIPKVVSQERNVVTLKTSIVLEPGMPVEFAKEHLARNMVETVREHMTYDLDDDNEMRPVLHGQLQIVI